MRRNFVDLRSDTVTKPTPGMLEAMMTAQVGDDVYGEDPTINTLEDRVAKLLGKQAGLFTPSGTMANQIAINLHTTPGSSVLAEEDSHVYIYEAGAAATQSGVQFDLIPFSENLSDESLAKYLRTENIHAATTKLLVIENTHNRGGGRVLDVRKCKRLTDWARGQDLKSHCDGARLWNAAAALQCSEEQLAAGFDTVSVCFSKGLGTPVGSVLVGSSEDISRARKIRKRWGGGMRQAGYLAAACLYALDHHRSRLSEDHQRAKKLYDGVLELAEMGLPVKPNLPKVWTNLVFIDLLSHSGAEISAAMKNEGVLINPMGTRRLRAVTHLEIDDEAVGLTLGALRRILRS